MRPTFKLELADSCVETSIDGGRKNNVILDVGGEKFLSNRDMIENYPATRLDQGTIISKSILFQDWGN